VSLPLADGFMASARAAGALACRSEVRDRWDLESACAGMTTGGLAHHLADQVRFVTGLLTQPPSDQEPIALADHYRRAGWVGAGLDEPFNTSIRDGSNALAAGGYDALVDQVRDDLAALPAALAAAPGRQPDTVLIPWQGWALSTHDFLVTRSMEIVVHSDDLAVSLDVAPPQFPEDVIGHVLALLTTVALERHGQTALVRTLSRPQRAPGTVSAFGA
jgi:hypothetical protein